MDMAEVQPVSVLLLAGDFQVRGSSAYTLRLAEHLPERGVAARTVCSSAEHIPERKRQRAAIRVMPALGRRIRWRHAVRQLADEIDTDRPDLVHVQSRAMAHVGLRLAALTGLPYVLTVHDFLGRGEKVAFSRTRGLKIIAVSDAVADDLTRSAGVPVGLIEVVRSGVEVHPQHADAGTGADASRTRVVGTAGPLERIKGHAYFLEAARIVLHEGHDAEFLIAGAGPEEEALRHLARRLGVADHVTFATYVREYAEVLEALDVFVLPSLAQGLGTVMLEAMALGKPVVATGVGGVYSVVGDGQTGLLTPSRDALALANNIIALLDNPGWARQLGREGQRVVAREFSVERMVRETADLYRRVLRPPLSAVGTGAFAGEPHDPPITRDVHHA